MSKDIDKFKDKLNDKDKDNNVFALSHKVKCSNCGGKITYLYSGIYKCEECGFQDFDDFGKIKSFLEQNGPTPAVIISENTGVPISIIDDYLRQGRIEIPNGSHHYIKCERCRTDIRYGRFCPDCVKELAGDIKKAFFNEAVGEKPKDNPGKMRFLGNDKK